MERQKIRMAIILISFLLFPITIYYLSPYLIIMSASEGIISGSFLVFSLQFVISLFFGRAFCGWICPAGGLQECCFMVRDKRARRGRLGWIKYFIWVPWIAGIIYAVILSGGIRKIEPLYQTKYGISVSEPSAYIIYYFIIFLIIILAFSAGKRAFCHYVCWMAPFMIIGTKISNAVRLPALRLSSDKEKCIKCGRCTKNCPMSLDVQEMVQKGSMYHAECILCGTCVDVCPKNVINFVNFRYSR